MEPTRSQVEELRRERVADSGRQTFAEKFRAGADLFDYACEVSKAGIRMQHPEYDERQVMQELRRRLEISARIEGRA